MRGRRFRRLLVDMRIRACDHGIATVPSGNAWGCLGPGQVAANAMASSKYKKKNER